MESRKDVRRESRKTAHRWKHSSNRYSFHQCRPFPVLGLHTKEKKALVEKKKTKGSLKEERPLRDAP